MRKFIYLFIFIFVFAIGLAFAVLNSQQVVLNYYFDSLEVPLSLALIITTLLGAIAGVLVGLLATLRLRQESARLRRSLKLAEKHNSELRTQQPKLPA